MARLLRPVAGAVTKGRLTQTALTGLMALLVALFGLLGAAATRAQDVLVVPALTARVMDSTGTLSSAQVQALQAKLAAFEAQAGPQIVLLVVAATAPEDITSYAQRVADQWKIGRRNVGDGVLVVVAKDERKVRIEVAKALEGAIPDLAARQIIDSAIRPAFRANDYAGGMNAAIDQLMGRIKGEGLPAPGVRPSGNPSEGLGLEELAIFFFVAVPIIGTVLTGLFGRRFGSMLTAGSAGGLGWVFTTSLLVAVGASVAALVVVGILGIGSALRRSGTSSGRNLPHIGGWGGGGGFGGGGGGFSSGGGGDFGGGGASGDW